MKALMIVTLMSGLTTEPAMMPSMETCLKAAPQVAEQTAVKSAACIPHTPKDHQKTFREMMAMFLDLSDTIEAKNFNDEVREERKESDDHKCGGFHHSFNYLLEEKDRCSDLDEDGDINDWLTKPAPSG